MTTTLRLRDIQKSFGQVTALQGVDLEVRPGTLHALLGENGAGKSTLMSVVYGLTRPDAGEMLLGGVRFQPRDPREARQDGIGMVHQHFTSVPALTVWENIALAASWPMLGARERAESVLREAGVALHVDARAESLSVGSRQQLELQKALASRPGLLLLDEPTGVLTPSEVDGLFRWLDGFTRSGGAVLLITHKLDEALAHADAITVLRRGTVTLDWNSAAGTPRPARGTLLTAMLGEDRVFAAPSRQRSGPGEIAATAHGLTLRAGEVVGVAGVEGNGQRELLRAFGTNAFIPEDRTTEGLIPTFTLTENLALHPRSRSPLRTGVQVDWRALRDRAEAVIVEFGIMASGPDAPASSLSGGNQQKVVIARALEGAPRVIVAENPARGLDVAAANAVFGRLRAAAAAGAAVLFYSTDLDEVMSWADRVLVITSGTLRTPPPGADRAQVGALMMASGEGQ